MSKIERLSKQIAKLQKELEEAQKYPAPKTLTNINWTKLLNEANELIEDTERNGRTDDDAAEHIFEAAMICIYGNTFWDWYNKVND